MYSTVRRVSSTLTWYLFDAPSPSSPHIIIHTSFFLQYSLHHFTYQSTKTYFPQFTYQIEHTNAHPNEEAKTQKINSILTPSDQPIAQLLKMSSSSSLNSASTTAKPTNSTSTTTATASQRRRVSCSFLPPFPPSPFDSLSPQSAPQNPQSNSLTKPKTKKKKQSSAASSQGQLKFAALHGQKRTSLDASAAARRASFAEQMQPVGFLGGLWNSLVSLALFTLSPPPFFLVFFSGTPRRPPLFRPNDIEGY